MSDAPTSLLLALRRHTAEAHARLDADLGPFDDGYGLDDLRRLVATLRHGHAHYRHAVERHEPSLAELGVTWRAPDRLVDLAADAADLGLPDIDRADLDRADLDRSDRDHLGLHPADRWSFLGMAYVFEGSVLGAAHLRTVLRELLGPDAPLRHFERAVEDGPAAWTSFRRMLGAVTVGSDQRSRVLDGAAATFAALAEQHRKLHPAPR